MQEAAPVRAARDASARRSDDSDQQVNPALRATRSRVLRVLRLHFPYLLPAEPCQFGDAGVPLIP